MEPDSNSNGHRDEVPRVKFGPRPNQDMPLPWAEDMLTLLATEHPKVFTTLLPRVALGR